MSFLNYIGEFFLFRWMFCKFRESTANHDAHIEDLVTSIDRDCGNDYLNSSRHNSYNDWNSRSCSQSYDDFHNEQDDYDMMDDDF